MLVLVWLDNSDLFLFPLIVLLNPIPNCSKSFLSSWVSKVTTGAYNFVSVILNVVFVELSIEGVAGFVTRIVSLVVAC